MLKLKRLMQERRGQSMAEYAMLLAFLIAAIMMIGPIFKNNIAGGVVAATKKYSTDLGGQIGAAVTPWAPNATQTSQSGQQGTYAGSGAVALTETGNSSGTSTSNF
jgi:Flp pilus assembly pilin Flp